MLRVKKLMNTLGWGVLDVGSRRLLVELERTKILQPKNWGHQEVMG